MKNTPRNKAKLFALYIRAAKVIFEEFSHNRMTEYEEVLTGIVTDMTGSTAYTEMSETGVRGCRLLLKPLSQITDEDAIEVIKLCESHIPEDLRFRNRESVLSFEKIPFKQAYQVYKDEEIIFANFSNSINGLSVYKGNHYWRCHTRTLDFLRSKGYALPWMGISIEDQIEFGWIKLIEE